MLKFNKRALIIGILCLIFLVSILFIDLEYAFGLAIVFYIFAKILKLAENDENKSPQQRYNTYLEIARESHKEKDYEKALSYFRRAKVYFDLSKEDAQIESECSEKC